MKTELVTEYIVNWLKEYATKAKVNGFVLGVSGGVDSAVTSTLCAMTGLPTLLVEMPIHQDVKQVNLAQAHIKQLKERFDNVRDKKIFLTSVFDEFKHQLVGVEISELSLGNTRARLRMTTLYYLAGVNNYLVVGTGNKVEDFGVGFFTKYGDGGVDISPIADLMKSEVYEVGKYVGVSEDILTVAPTDGLFGDSRTDEDQIGATYDELEWAMKYYTGTTANDINLGVHMYEDCTERQKKVMKIYLKRNRANKHKMIPIPVCDIPKELE